MGEISLFDRVNPLAHIGPPTTKKGPIQCSKKNKHIIYVLEVLCEIAKPRTAQTQCSSVSVCRRLTHGNRCSEDEGTRILRCHKVSLTRHMPTPSHPEGVKYDCFVMLHGICHAEAGGKKHLHGSQCCDSERGF